ncbi:hypothetical protein [Clostridiisalibacter paucivorans]|uniref:hypothetical protein n=1 Tax=Clostridiisalibacter paucivorans TaxID=408753 RepID=UPI00047DB241|nr:hypothetical protein [Clostridiisalibacter paucivorans]
MKKVLSIIMIVCILCVNVSSVFAVNRIGKINYSKVNYDKIENNYVQALTKAGKLKEKEDLFANENIDFNYKKSNSSTYIKTFDDNTTISVSEDGYAVSKIEGKYIKVFENFKGDVKKVRINLDSIENKLEKIRNADVHTEITPRSETYDEELDSFMGYFSYHERRATNNYRYYRLTVPKSDGSLETMDKGRGTALDEIQEWEETARMFLDNLENSIYLAEDLEGRIEDLALDAFDLVLDVVPYGKVVEGFMIMAEAGFELKENGWKAATITLITSTVSSVSDYISNVQTFVDMGYSAAEFPTYILSLKQLKKRFDAF